MRGSRLAFSPLAFSLLALAACGGGTPPATCVTDGDCAPGLTCAAGVCADTADGGIDGSSLPDLVVTPTALDFGSAGVGDPVALELTLTNTGGATLHVSRLELVEVDALAEFSSDPSGRVALDLAPGATTTVMVTLDPKDAEADRGELIVHSDDPDAPTLSVALNSVVEGAPELSITPDAIDFDVVDWGTVAAAEVAIRNSGNGNAPLELATVRLTDTTGAGAVYSLELALVNETTGAASPATPPIFLAPGALYLRARVAVDTIPLGAGQVPAEALVLTTDLAAPDDEQRVPIRGAVLGCAAPAAETCDGTDENCDLEVDDNDPGGGASCATGLFGVCSPGSTACLAGVLECVALSGPTPEECDNVDTDCDGLVDGGLVRACTRGCDAGVEFCAAGIWSSCNAPVPAPDLCNGLDDDCTAATADGTDDPALGLPCDGADADLCLEGALACAGGVLVCAEAAASTLDLCNGLDDDCNAATVDGSHEPTIGSACDGADTDLCVEGVRFCFAGALYCSDAGPNLSDVCNGVDDDCDPASADGAEDPISGTACDGADSDLCAEGLRACVLGAFACTDDSGSNADLCNGLNDDCDLTSTDGSEDPGVGVACDGADSDFCTDGAFACAGGALGCADPGPNLVDLCGGGNEDCDVASADGTEDPAVGVPCDGADSDLCNEGTVLCASGFLGCTDTTGHAIELCNGANDDCNAATADGSADPGIGVACDGTDTDLCVEGTRICTGGALACSDTTTSTVDLCNTTDDDCDSASADGTEDPANGLSCDGADTDLCFEGTRFCAAGVLECNDATGSTTEICNGLNDDCNTATADGSADPGLGVACDGTDLDACIEGTRICSFGALACNDLTGSSLEACNGADDDCDAVVDDGGAALCAPPPNATAACNGFSGCGIGACLGGFGNCDGVVANGCESPLLTDEANCGSCGVVCAPGRTCTGGSCSATCGNGVLDPGEEYEPPPGPFTSAPVSPGRCRYDFSAVRQLYCNGTCSWSGSDSCDQTEADILCKLKKDNPLSVATSWRATTALPEPGFPCTPLGYGTPLTSMASRGVAVAVSYQDSSILADHGGGTVIVDVVCTNP